MNLFTASDIVNNSVVSLNHIYPASKQIDNLSAEPVSGSLQTRQAD